jgi:hypothetical protein
MTPPVPVAGSHVQLFSHLIDPTGGVYPTAHVQESSETLPAGELDLSLQSEHDPDPVADLYEPAGHASHWDPPGPVYPALHIQASSETLPAGEFDPSIQSEHGPDPVTDLYVPTGHASHWDPSGPVYPALHVQAALPAGELDLSLQTEHDPDPAADLYVPGGHAVHATPSDDNVYPVLHWKFGALSSVCEFAGLFLQVNAPGMSLYVPARHHVQT